MNERIKHTVNICCGHEVKLICHFRSLKSYSQAFQKRTAVASTNPSPSNLQLIDFLGRYKKPQPPVNLRLTKTPQTTDTWRQKPLALPVPSRLDVKFTLYDFMYFNFILNFTLDSEPCRRSLWLWFEVDCHLSQHCICSG